MMCLNSSFIPLTVLCKNNDPIGDPPPLTLTIQFFVKIISLWKW